MTLDDDPVQIWRPYLQQLPAHHDPSSFILANLEDQVLNGVPRVLTRRNETLVRVTDVYDGGYNQSPSVAAYELTPKSRKIIVQQNSIRTRNPFKTFSQTIPLYQMD
ncbi:uncharacterized protein AKAW2_80116A [Aspergillus luchuensis]|uniref:Uncharacterized protein n=1 Tax=Aspergillus kawachii TaxID=1069201 RepID=A0A7R8A4Q0_ASPKA|nr:uncharacterized protein AKAW2_80116A [Aspergillus luchuensis]BCS04315.1 hypothetical protein AKAW2_80116A [Aspergillus luchuensis]